MKILIAEDEAVSRRLLESTLHRWGYEVISASDGLEAFNLLHLPDAPQLAILDWLMPGFDGLQLCKQIRQHQSEPYTYILLLTGRNAQLRCDRGAGCGSRRLRR